MASDSTRKSPMSRLGKSESLAKGTQPSQRSQNIYDFDGLLSTQQQEEIKTSLMPSAFASTGRSLLDQKWRDLALCKGMTAKFFRHSCSPRCSHHPLGCSRVKSVRECREMCAACPALEQCRVWAVHDTDMVYGFVGGMTETERSTLRSMVIGDSNE